MLLLCTANQCRSPMAEGLLARRLGEAGVRASVSSAGLMRGGAPATAHAVRTVARRGVDLSGHRSRTLAPELVEGADLVLGMTREHVREAVVLVPHALAKAFTLKELVARAEMAGRRRADESLADWLGRAGAGRRASDLLGATSDPELDIADPVGGPASAYERTAAEIDELVERLVELAWSEAATRERSA